MAKVSIVVPVYNVEKYLVRCLETIRLQTLQDIEVILIDDGSTDQSGQICDSFAQTDSRFKVVHIENAGVSNARNLGIELATGEYIGFSDADDYMETDMYETLYQTAVEQQSDLTMISIWVHLLSGRVVERFATGKIYVWEDSEPIKWFLLDQKFCYSCYAHLFKAEFCKQHKFIIGKKVHEDRYYTFEMLKAAKKVCVNDQCKYHYILRKNSATTSKFSGKQLDIIYFADRIFDDIKKYYPQYMEEAQMYVLQAYIDVYKSIIKGHGILDYQEELKKIKELITSVPMEVIKKHYPAIRVCEIGFIRRCPHLYMTIILGIRLMKETWYRSRSGLMQMGIMS